MREAVHKYARGRVVLHAMEIEDGNSLVEVIILADEYYELIHISRY